VRLVWAFADGGYRPAYNAQLATDSHSGLIAGVAVDNLGSDMSCEICGMMIH
jgi:hypothetical protein